MHGELFYADGLLTDPAGEMRQPQWVCTKCAWPGKLRTDHDWRLAAAKCECWEEDWLHGGSQGFMYGWSRLLASHSQPAFSAGGGSSLAISCGGYKSSLNRDSEARLFYLPDD